MAKDSFKFDSAAIGDLFNTNSMFSIPDFQRGYVWSTTSYKKQGERLWEDIVSILNGDIEKIFLGPILIDQVETSLLSDNEAEIVDGQQRLLTLYLLVLALMREAEINGNEGLKSLCESRLTFTGNDKKKKPKITPGLKDREQFATVFKKLNTYKNDQSLILPQEYGSKKGRLVDMYNYHFNRVKQYTRENKEYSSSEHEKLAKVVLESLILGSIEIPETFDTNEVFRVLNEGGAPLDASELVRNLIYQKVKKIEPENQDSFFGGVWKKFEEEINGEETNVDNYTDFLYRFTLIIDSNATKGTQFRILRSHWDENNSDHNGIRAELRSWVPSFRTLHLGPSEALDTFDDDTAKTYLSDEEISSKLESFSQVVPSSMYSFFMRLLERFEDGLATSEDLISCIEIAESFHVRRSVAAFPNVGVHNIFKDLWPDPDKIDSTNFPGLLSTTLVNSEHVRFPTDAEFEDAIRTGNFYGRKLAVFIMLEFEKGKHSGSGQNPENWPQEPTKEHIIPKKYREDSDYVITKEQHGEIRDTWGNLCLLTKELNGQLQDRDWEEKRVAYTDTAAFPETRNIGSSNEKMGYEQIIQRGNELVEWALERWETPAVTPTSTEEE